MFGQSPRHAASHTPSTPRSAHHEHHLTVSRPSADGAEAGAGGDDPAAKKLKAADEPAAPVADAAATGSDGDALATDEAAASADAAPAAAAKPAGAAGGDAGEPVQQDAAMDPDDQGEPAEDGAAAEAPDEEGGGDGGGGDAANGDAPEEAEIAGEKAEEKPVTLGYKTFASGKECFDYFHKLLSKLTPNQDLNEVRGTCTRPVPFCGSVVDCTTPDLLMDSST